MGYGSYSVDSRATRSVDRGYTTKSVHEIFQQRSINNAMSPLNAKPRESRDSQEHPNSVPIIVGLDVTGSMGSVPHNLVKNGLPNMMQGIIDAGIPDPQVLFLGIGDHEYDSSPLQIGQFESNDELLDKWLTDVWLEGGGGANNGESYLLAWYVASRLTVTDSLEKRRKKGYLFTIGDEPNLFNITKTAQQHILGIGGQYADQNADRLLELAREKYHVYHINIQETFSGGRPEVLKGWQNALGTKYVINVQSSNLVASAIAKIVSEVESGTSSNAETDLSTDQTSTTNEAQDFFDDLNEEIL